VQEERPRRWKSCVLSSSRRICAQAPKNRVVVVHERADAVTGAMPRGRAGGAGLGAAGWSPPTFFIVVNMEYDRYLSRSIQIKIQTSLEEGGGEDGRSEFYGKSGSRR